jgi:hypothetical protein
MRAAFGTRQANDRLRGLMARPRGGGNVACGVARASGRSTRARRPRDTPIWKLEPALKCRSCRTPRYSPPVRMIKLTKEREIAPYAWVHPDDDDRNYRGVF